MNSDVFNFISFNQFIDSMEPCQVALHKDLEPEDWNWYADYTSVLMPKCVPYLALIKPSHLIIHVMEN